MSNFGQAYLDAYKTVSDVKQRRLETNARVNLINAQSNLIDENTRSQELKNEQLQMEVNQLKSSIAASRFGDAINAYRQHNNVDVINSSIANDPAMLQVANDAGYLHFYDKSLMSGTELQVAREQIAALRGIEADKLSPEVIQELDKDILVGVTTDGKLNAIDIGQLGIFLPNVGREVMLSNSKIKAIIADADKKRYDADKAGVDVDKAKLDLRNQELVQGLRELQVSLASKGDNDNAKKLQETLDKLTNTKRSDAEIKREIVAEAKASGNLIKALQNTDSNPIAQFNVAEDFMTNAYYSITGTSIVQQEDTREIAKALQTNTLLKNNIKPAYNTFMKSLGDGSTDKRQAEFLDKTATTLQAINVKPRDVGILDGNLKQALGAFMDVYNIVGDKASLNALDKTSLDLLQGVRDNAYLNTKTFGEIQKLFARPTSSYIDNMNKLLVIAEMQLSAYTKLSNRSNIPKIALAKQAQDAKDAKLLAEAMIDVYNSSKGIFRKSINDLSVASRVSKDGNVIMTIPDKPGSYTAEQVAQMQSNPRNNYVVIREGGKVKLVNVNSGQEYKR